MKKLKRISAVLLLAAGFALAFGGCSNTKDETETEQGGGAGSGGETGGTGGSENPGDSGSGSGNNSGNTGNAGDSGTSSGGQESKKEYLSLDTESLDAGWNSTYDGKTKTIKFNDGNDYGGRGWAWGWNAYNASAYTKITVAFSDVSGDDKWVQLVAEYTEDGDNGTAAGKFDADGYKLTLDLDATRKSSIKQFYIQGKPGASVTIKEAYFE